MITEKALVLHGAVVSCAAITANVQGSIIVKVEITRIIKTYTEFNIIFKPFSLTHIKSYLLIHKCTNYTELHLFFPLTLILRWWVRGLADL